jgi:hypothetical protein
MQLTLLISWWWTRNVFETCRELRGNKVLWRDICWLFLDKLTLQCCQYFVHKCNTNILLVGVFQSPWIHTCTAQGYICTGITSCGTSQAVEWLQGKRPKNRVSIPEGNKEFICPQKRREWHWVPSTFLLRGNMIFCTWGKSGGSGNMTTHPPPSVDIEKKYLHFPICVPGLYRDSFTCNFTCLFTLTTAYLFMLCVVILFWIFQQFSY